MAKQSDPPSKKTKLDISKWVPAIVVAVIIVVIVYVFPSQVASLILRTKDIKLDFKKGTAQVEFTEAVQTQMAQVNDLQADITTIVDATSGSQDKAITVAWEILEKRLRRIFAATHWNDGVFVDVRSGIASLIDLGVLPKNNLQNLKVIEDEHNRILMHHEQVNKVITESAIITSIQMLKALYSISEQQNFVEDINIKLYDDPECKNEIPGVTGIMIKEIMIEGLQPRFDVFPTTRTDYRVGERLTWDWNMSRILRSAWYKDPKTGKINMMSAAEFVGSDIDNL